jgi:antitoxin Phd
MAKKYSTTPSKTSRVNELPTITATALKNSTADILDQVAAGQAVAITRHDKPRAVLVPFDQYWEARQSQQTIVQDLIAEYQGMLDEMQKPEQKAAAKRLFEATPEELGEAAVRGAKRRINYQIKP